ncbi:HVA22-like protein k [Argentina anserina]|uniref:HVA22-like protein k n=1 Tax=Argentina anserina TaxID=57926 RepID=UPI0021762959|nr:HVA22-like protein k [Potentilla anserina]
MAFPPAEVGLGLLLCPLGSNVIVRTACCSVGVALPVYSTFKAIESKDRKEQQRMLLYWAAYGSFSIAEVFADRLISWVPLYYQIKFAFLVWLQLPSTNGAKHLYMRHLGPFLRRHQVRLDQVVEYINAEANKFISSHQEELKFAWNLIVKILGSATGLVKGLVHPGQQKKPNRAIRGRGEQAGDSGSDQDD